MECVVTDGKIPIKCWIKREEIEEGAMKQLTNLSNLPFAYHHIAVMPDTHQGYGMPIGGVLATNGVIIPNAVGVDIGCGMRAVQTNINVKGDSKDFIKRIMGRVKEVIPMGFNHQETSQRPDLIPMPFSIPIVEREYGKALKQLGTLGGGNHFIELQRDDSGKLWVMIHSGSRNLGKQVADYYNKLAEEKNEDYYAQVPKSWGLAFFPEDSTLGKQYISEMNYCIEFAKANRRLMMNMVIRILRDETQWEDYVEPMIEEPIDVCHNYAQTENHFGRNVLVHRKGATLAREGVIGVIPGSQGTNSYIVRGKGNPDSFNSCSHGAGRRMSRTKAQNELVLEDEIKRLNDQGIVHGIRCAKDLDEASGAYKDIAQVMKYQEDLVDIVYKLTPIGVLKG